MIECGARGEFDRYMTFYVMHKRMEPEVVGERPSYLASIVNLQGQPPTTAREPRAGYAKRFIFERENPE